MKKDNIFKKINKKGFSLIELMVVVVILGLMVLGLVTFFTGGARSWISGQSQLEAQRNARQAMDIMVRKIREADYVYDSSTSISIVFHTPFDDNISYSLNTLISNVQSLTFSYFDNDSNPVDSAEPDKKSKVSKVHINLQVDVDQDTNPDITLNSDIDLRNYNL